MKLCLPIASNPSEASMTDSDVRASIIFGAWLFAAASAFGSRVTGHFTLLAFIVAIVLSGVFGP